MLTRRYWVAYDYDLKKIDYNLSGYNLWFDDTNTTAIGNQVCVTGITPASFDQEENKTTPDTTIISPNVVGKLVFCGEANVMSVNNGEHASASGLITSTSGVMKATVARSALDNGFSAGWISLATPGLGLGLPILGDEFVRATSAPSTFGSTWEHRWNRTQPQ